MTGSSMARRAWVTPDGVFVAVERPEFDDIAVFNVSYRSPGYTVGRTELPNHAGYRESATEWEPFVSGRDARWLLAELQHQLESERLAHAITKARLEEADTEIVRLRHEVEFEASAVDTAMGPPTGHDPVDHDRCRCGEAMHTTRDWFDHWRRFVLCACVPVEEAEALAATGKFDPIRCSVHPTGSGFCCSEPRPVRDAGEPDEHVIECGTCGADMDEDMLNRWRAQVGA